jgi:hypothetical protein
VQEQVNSLLGATLSRNCQIHVQPASHAGDIGRVSVQVPMTNASPDLLWMVGYQLTNRLICADASMVMERSASTYKPQRL